MNGLTLAGTPIKHFHVCAFFNSRDEEYETLLPFFKEAIEQGEKNFHIVNPSDLFEHRDRLSAAGIDVMECEACGQLELHTWTDTYIDEKHGFDKDRMLASLEEISKAARDAGYPRVRVMGNMEWVFGEVPGAQQILEYEAEVNEVLAHNQLPAVCVYDVAKLSGAMLMDLLRTHPLTLVNGALQENPFYTSPSEMLKELKSRQE